MKTVSLQSALTSIRLCSLDLRKSAGVTFTNPCVRAEEILGFCNINNGIFTLYESRITLQQNETYHGELSVQGELLDCNGYQFHVTGGLEQYGTVVELHEGTLKVDGNYSIEGSSVLQMRCPGDLLQIAGDFSMASSLSHSNMLNNGRFELGGNFNQSGDSASFGSNGNFVIAFTGDGTQRVHFENKDYSQFAHVDPAYADYQEDETGLVVTARITYNICCGIIEGFQEMFTMPELSDTAEKILLVLGVSIAAGVLLAPEVVIPILQTCATLILFFLSAFTVVQAGSNIYSTATGNGDKYEKARKFGKDGIILLVSVIAFKGAVGSLVQDAKFVKNLLMELKTRKISELCGNTNLVKVLTINSASDAQLIVKTCLDETALTCFNQQTGKYSLAQLKNITEVVTTVYERTGVKLTAVEVSKGIEELGETDEVGTAVENVVRYHNNGGALSPSEIARSWQGTSKYPGIDNYSDIIVKKGERIYRGEPNGTEYFTTRAAIEQCGREATAIFEGLQVEKNPIYGYRGTMQGYIVSEDIKVAYGLAEANPQFGKGGLPQLFVPNVQELIDQKILIPADSILLIK